MAKPYVSVIIPAYNEEKRLPLTLIDVDKHLTESDYSYEILVVDDASTDRTPSLVENFATTIKGLKLVRLEQNSGKGGAVRKGMEVARGNIRLFMDADNATSIEHFDKMIPFFKEGYGVVIGSREHKQSRLSPPQPFHKRILGRVGNLIIQVLVLPGMKDTQCGFKAFTEEAAELVFPHMRITRWAFDVEALLIAKKHGFRIKEIPVIWVNNAESKVKPSAYIKTLLEVVKIRLWAWMGKYSFAGGPRSNKDISKEEDVPEDNNG